MNRLEDPKFWGMLIAAIAPPVAQALMGTVGVESMVGAIVSALVAGYLGIKQESGSANLKKVTRPE